LVGDENFAALFFRNCFAFTFRAQHAVARGDCGGGAPDKLLQPLRKRIRPLPPATREDTTAVLRRMRPRPFTVRFFRVQYDFPARERGVCGRAGRGFIRAKRTPAGAAAARLSLFFAPARWLSANEN